MRGGTNMAGATRDLGPSKNQSKTYDAIGMAEDFSPVLVNIDPEVTKFLSRFSEAGDAVSTRFGGFTERLRPPQENANFEKTDYTSKEVGSLKAWENYVQYFLQTGYITDTQEKVRKIYNGKSEMARELHNAFLGQAKDIEYALAKNDVKRAESGSQPAKTGGVPYFMQQEIMAVTVATADGKVTCATPHELNTGDFVYFTADTMPTGLAGGTAYYVRLDPTTPTTAFTLYKDIKGANENLAAYQVKPTTAGTNVKIVANNVVSLGGTSTFSLADINNAMQMAVTRGGNPTDAFMSGNNKRRFTELAAATATTTRSPKERAMTQVINTYESDFGTVNSIHHRLYSDDTIHILDMNFWNLKWMDRTKAVKGIAKKGSYTEFAVESRLGLEGNQPKASCAITNIKS